MTTDEPTDEPIAAGTTLWSTNDPDFQTNEPIDSMDYINLVEQGMDPDDGYWFTYAQVEIDPEEQDDPAVIPSDVDPDIDPEEGTP